LISYNQIETIPLDYLRDRIRQYLLEDAPRGDITTQGTVDEDVLAQAEISAVEPLIFCGELIVPVFFEGEYRLDIPVHDGEAVPAGQILARIGGNAREILIRERALLNLLQHLCGIATQTREYVSRLAGRSVRILDTRKTLPGLRLLEKYAVHCGGGTNHRLDLSDGILIKDNHLKAAGGVKAAVERIRYRFTGIPVELEVDTFDQLKEGLDSAVDGFLLDNMSPDQIREAVSIIRHHPHGRSVLIEASGGITLDRLNDYLDCGIDAVSIGALTHSARSRDIRMEFSL